MATDAIEVSGVVPARPEVLYSAWLDSQEHSQMTGATATGSGAVGAVVTAWDGYISGRIVALEPYGRIVQSWRTVSFPEDAPDSDLTILFEAAPGGTRVTFVHTGIPAGQGKDYETGWVEHYLEPMARYWSTEAEEG